MENISAIKSFFQLFDPVMESLIKGEDRQISKEKFDVAKKQFIEEHPDLLKKRLDLMHPMSLLGESVNGIPSAELAEIIREYNKLKR